VGANNSCSRDINFLTSRHQLRINLRPSHLNQPSAVVALAWLSSPSSSPSADMRNRATTPLKKAVSLAHACTRDAPTDSSRKSACPCQNTISSTSPAPSIHPTSCEPSINRNGLPNPFCDTTTANKCERDNGQGCSVVGCEALCLWKLPTWPRMMVLLNLLVEGVVSRIPPDKDPTSDHETRKTMEIDTWR
jgi:hypothetical protein